MSSRSFGFRLYAGFTVVAIVVCVWFLIRNQGLISSRYEVPEEEPKKAAAPTAFEAFPYDRRGGRAIITVARPSTEPGAAPLPVFWIKGNGVCIRKVSWEDDALDYRKRIVPRDRVEAILTRLLELPAGKPSGDAPLTVTLKGERSPAPVPTDRAALEDILGDLLKAGEGREHTLAGIRLVARPVEAAEGAKWPIARVSIRDLVRDGELVSRNRDANRSIQRRLKSPTTFKTDESVVRVRAYPEVDA